jgi:hypothetical protein
LPLEIAPLTPNSHAVLIDAPPHTPTESSKIKMMSPPQINGGAVAKSCSE